MLYSGNRKLGIVPVGTPDMNSLYSGSAAIDSEINAFKITSIQNTSNVSNEFNIFSKKNQINFNSNNFPNNFSLKQSFTGNNIGRSVATNKDGTVFIIDNGLGNGGNIYTGNSQLGWRLRQSLINNTFSGDIGSSVSINPSGTVIVMGGFSFNHPGTGVTLIYTGNAQSNWVLKQVLTGISSGDGFGQSLTINNSENVLTIGRSTSNNNVGGVSIYTGNSQFGWQLKQIINISSGSGERYGTSVAMNNDSTVLMIGGPSDSYLPNPPGGMIFGGALVYTGNVQRGWGFKQKLSADSFADQFGTSVAINKDGTVLAMGGIYDTPNDAGSVMVFTGNAQLGWELKQKLVGDSMNDQFGSSVSINDLGTIIAMGGPGDDDGGNNAGAVIVYSGTQENGWAFKEKITGNIPNGRMGFRTAINNDGTIILIGTNSSSDYQVFAYTGNFINELYQINPNNENIVEVSRDPLFVNISGNWNGYAVKWEVSNDKINWTGFNLRENFNSTGQSYLNNNGIFVYSGYAPTGYQYLRLRNPGSDVNLITDTRREEIARARLGIPWIPPNYGKSGTLSGTLIYYSPDTSKFESEWPKPCEYFNGTILAPEFPVELQGINEIGIPIPYIVASGVSGYSIIQNILNTTTGFSSIIEGSFFENGKYEFIVKEKIVTGNQTGIVGNLISLNLFGPSFNSISSESVGTFYLEASGKKQNLITFFNNSNSIYSIESNSNNQSTTYQSDNTIHICKG